MSRLTFTPFYVTVKQVTEKAIRIEFDDITDDEWVPRSGLSTSCDRVMDEINPPEMLDIEIADWLVNKNGW